MSPIARARRIVLRGLPSTEQRLISEALRKETVGGVLLLVAAAIALAWASSPWSEAYDDLRHVVIGPSALNLDLDLETWTADGLLAIFFFVAGVELKRELVVGQLRKPSEAVLPMVAAVAGMVVPALLYLGLVLGEAGAAKGWAVPIATDIAFALAVLAVLGSALPSALRAFLLTLAVVDDLGAILVIAVGFTDDLDLVALGGGAAGVALWAYLQYRRVLSGWLLVPLAVVTWALVHESGVHATIAGVALGMATRVRRDPDEHTSPAEHLEHVVRPISAGVAVPLFALMAAGVAVTPSSLGEATRDSAAVAVVVALVLGKFIGVFGATWLTVRLTSAELSPDLRWGDVGAVAFISGIGFTVSLLITDLAFTGEQRLDHVKVAVLAGSLLSAVLAGISLRVRTNRHRTGRGMMSGNRDTESD